MHKDIFVHAGIYAINWEANCISISLPRVIDEVPAGHLHSHINDTALQGKEKPLTMHGISSQIRTQN
jgi:hypothetical protein